MNASRSLLDRTTSALLWSYAGAAGKVLAQLVIQVALARLLGPGPFGQVSLVMVVLGLGWLLADGGFGAALIQKPQLRDEDIAYALGSVLALSCAMGALILATAPFIAILAGDAALTPLFRACGLLVPLQALSNVPVSLLRRNLDMRRQQFIGVASYIVGMGCVGLSLAWFGFGAWSLVAGFAAQTAIALVAGYAVTRHPLRLRFTGDAGLRQFGLSVMGTNIANWSIDNLDKVVIGRLWGFSSLGQYAAMASLAQAPVGIVVGSVQAVVFASASRAQHDKSAVAQGFLAAASAVLLVSAPVFCFLALHAPLVVETLYGSRWAGASPLFSALSAGVPAIALLSVAGPALWGVGAAKSEFKVQLLAVPLLPLGLWLLSPFPMHQAVWLVPAFCILRAGFVVAALARNVQLKLRSLLRAATGGALLTAVVVLAVIAAKQPFDTPWSQAIGAAALTVGLAAVLLRLCPAWLVSPDLQSLLLAQAGRSRHLSRLCLALRLVPAAP